MYLCYATISSLFYIKRLLHSTLKIIKFRIYRNLYGKCIALHIYCNLIHTRWKVKLIPCYLNVGMLHVNIECNLLTCWTLRQYFLKQLTMNDNNNINVPIRILHVLHINDWDLVYLLAGNGNTIHQHIHIHIAIWTELATNHCWKEMTRGENIWSYLDSWYLITA